MMLKIHRLTAAELEKYRERCNFTKRERKCFDLKAQNRSAVQIADELHCSVTTVSNITKVIKIKVDKVEKDAA